MIKAIEVVNYLGESKKFVLNRPDETGIVVKNIDGLGPSKSSIVTKDAATIDGSLYNGAKTESRNITLDMDFRYAKNVEDIRHETYKYFPNKKLVRLYIETDKRTCYADGYIESNDPDIFSEHQTTKISILCPNPYLYSEFKALTVFSTIEPNFEFPFSNPIGQSSIMFSYRRDETRQNIAYNGDADTGMEIHIEIKGHVEDITIINDNTREQMFIDSKKFKEIMGDNLKFGDEIIISTIKGNKFAQLHRDGKYTNILNCLDKSTTWFQLKKGDNIFSYKCADKQQEASIYFTVTNNVLYEGV